MDALDSSAFASLLERLSGDGHTLVGPRVDDGTIRIGPIETIDDLPEGVTLERAPGACRLVADGAPGERFAHTVGPDAWRRALLPARDEVFRATRNGATLRIEPSERAMPKRALIGVRPCDLEALGSLDRVFGAAPFADPRWVEARAASFVVAVHCTRPDAACFCASTGCGPRAGDGCDLALTEIVEDGEAVYLTETRSERGREVVDELPSRAARPEEIAAAERRIQRATRSMGRTLDRSITARRGFASDDHPHWEALESRCFGCGNCTQVCPTCFCHTIEDTADLSGAVAVRTRHDDSCFTSAFSYIHGGSVRASLRSRYRQWITHKLVTFRERFDAPGCVGCGRCIAWCPAGIDVTEEARALEEVKR